MRSVVRIFLFAAALYAALNPSSSAAEELPRSRWPELLQPARVDALLTAALQQSKRRPDDFDAHLRVAQVGFYAWRLENKDLKRRLQFANVVLRAGEEAVRLKPNHPGGHHWLGAGVGMIGLTQGVLNSLQLVPRLKDAMEKSVELNPGWLHASAMAQLARLYTMVPGFPVAIGDLDKAEKYAREAIRLEPNYALQRLYLADLLWYRGKNDEALAELARLEKLKPVDELTYFALETSRVKARELAALIRKGETRARFYDVLSDIQPGLVR